MAYTSNVHDHLLSHTSKRSIKFLLCFSLLCVLFSLLPLLLQSLKPFLMQFFSYIVEKSYMFLLCNGLLILIVLNSALVNASSPPTTHQSTERVVPIEKIIRLESTEPDIAVAAPIVVDVTQSTQQEEKVLVIVEQENVLSDTYEGEEEEEGNTPAMIIAVAAQIVVDVTQSTQQEEKVLVIVEQESVLSDTYEGEEEEEGNTPAMIIDEDEDDEHGVDDTEELNKKCEDFIKRMKATFSSNNLEARVPDGFNIDNQISLAAVN